LLMHCPREVPGAMRHIGFARCCGGDTRTEGIFCCAGSGIETVAAIEPYGIVNGWRRPSPTPNRHGFEGRAMHAVDAPSPKNRRELGPSLT
jgi:hypothetical protein